MDPLRIRNGKERRETMGNRIARIILGIVIGIAALIGIYLVLPGSIKHPLQEWFQSTFQSAKHELAETYKKAKVPGFDVTFGTMLEKAGDGSSWIVDVIDESEDGSSGTYEVYAYAQKVDLALEPENGQDNQVNYSKAEIEIQFNVQKKNGSPVTTSYIIRVDDVPQSDHYRSEILKCLGRRAGGK